MTSVRRRQTNADIAAYERVGGSTPPRSILWMLVQACDFRPVGRWNRPQGHRKHHNVVYGSADT